MPNRRIISILVSLGVVISTTLGFLIRSRSDQNDLVVRFFDVGQGDAILVSIGDRQMLIDGGRDGRTLLEKLGRAIPFWDRTIEVLIATHPDQDHIGGLSAVLDRYKISTIVMSPAESESKVAANFFEGVASEGAQVLDGYAGMKIKINSGAEVEILSPSKKESQGTTEDSTNSESVVARLIFDSHSFMFTGDLPAEQEQELMASGEGIQADILKVAHHGSKYSTTDNFLDAIRPQEAVISVGARNSYGHPNSEVLSRLRDRGIRVWRTDEQGDIEFICKQLVSACTTQSSR